MFCGMCYHMNRVDEYVELMFYGILQFGAVVFVIE